MFQHTIVSHQAKYTGVGFVSVTLVTLLSSLEVSCATYDVYSLALLTLVILEPRKINFRKEITKFYDTHTKLVVQLFSVHQFSKTEQGA